MQSDVQCPRPVRPFKRCLEDIDYDPTSSASKTPRLSPLSSPASSNERHPAQVPRPNHPADGVVSWPTTKRKRAPEDPKSDYAPSAKYRRLQSRASSHDSLIHQWLSEAARPSTTPPSHHDIEPVTPISDSIDRPRSAPAEADMPQQEQRPGSVASTQSGRPSTSSSIYRSLIRRHNIIIDSSGRRMPKEIKELLDTHILKGRSSPPLTQEEVLEVVETAEDLMDSAESKASDLIKSKAFPVKPHGIAEGRDTLWTTDPLPRNPLYPHPLSTPKPDFHYGYPSGHKSDLPDEAMAVLDHQVARPFTQPTRENILPFLMLEVKSEATGGTLYIAENQAVGSGVHSVEALRWLLSQAFPSKVPAVTDAIAFTGAITPRSGVFYILWYSEEHGHHVMSKFKNVSFLEGPDNPDIQECRNVMKNMLDFGLEIRRPIITEALGNLFPFPSHWKKGRPASAVYDTPAPSSNAEEPKSRKCQRR